MKITIARTAGFCMGVRRAVDMVLDAANSTSEPICTYGPLIHNPQVLEMLAEKNIPALNAVPEKGEGIALVRAHGVPPDEKKALEAAGFTVMDATCPRVIRVQTIIRKHYEKGYTAIIVGDAQHPEVRGLLGYAGDRGITVTTLEAFQGLPVYDKAVVVAQTTQNTDLYQSIKDWVMAHRPHYEVFDTICHSTEKRQAETRHIAAKSDVTVVVGGKESGNTRRLAEVARETGKPAMHIEDVSELDFSLLGPKTRVAITAGASTPNWIITRTCRAIEEGLQAAQMKNRTFFALRDLLLKTNLLLAAGAGGLTWACAALQQLDHTRIHAAVAFLYVLSMQILNNLFSISSDRYNHPGRAGFYESHKAALIGTAVVSGAAGLIISFFHDRPTFMVLMIMSALGLSYSFNIIPGSLSAGRIRALKDIPGSKTILIAMAWGTVTTILPAMGHFNLTAAGISFVYAAGLVFSRTAFFNVLEMQGDRITGKETLPLILGEENSLRLIKSLLAGLCLMMLAAAVTGLSGPVGFLLAALPVLMLFVIVRTEYGEMLPGTQLEFIVESHFVLTGILGFFF